MSAVIVITVILALTFDFINGFHDTANSIATAVSTRALSTRHAIIMAACMNFLGAVLFTGVAETIANDIVELNTLSYGNYVLIAALISAILWNLITWFFGIPSSSSHTLIGSLAGAALCNAGLSSIKWHGFISILESLIFSPLIAFAAGYVMFSLFKIFFKNLNLHKSNNVFRKIQIVTAAVQSFSHGTNDAQKSMGIITMSLVSAGFISAGHVPLWVQVSCAAAMAFGASLGGWRIIKTVGTQIMKIRPVNGVAADMASAAVIFTASHVGLPVSTTHVISSSIMGVGSAYRIRSVKWDTARKMVTTWFITIPISGCIAAGIFALMMIFV